MGGEAMAAKARNEAAAVRRPTTRDASSSEVLEAFQSAAERRVTTSNATPTKSYEANPTAGQPMTARGRAIATTVRDVLAGGEGETVETIVAALVAQDQPDYAARDARRMYERRSSSPLPDGLTFAEWDAARSGNATTRSMGAAPVRDPMLAERAPLERAIRAHVEGRDPAEVVEIVALGLTEDWPVAAIPGKVEAFDEARDQEGRDAARA